MLALAVTDVSRQLQSARALRTHGARKCGPARVKGGCGDRADRARGPRVPGSRVRTRLRTGWAVTVVTAMALPSSTEVQPPRAVIGAESEAALESGGGGRGLGASPVPRTLTPTSVTPWVSPPPHYCCSFHPRTGRCPESDHSLVSPTGHFGETPIITLDLERLSPIAQLYIHLLSV